MNPELSTARRGLATRAIGALAIALMPATALAATPSPNLVTLWPGTMIGHVNPYEVKRGDTVIGISTRFTVHPVRVTKPSARELADGLERGETIFVDQRRVVPRFSPELSGIVLNLPEAHVYLVKDGVLLRDYPVGVSNSDWKAPIGRTHVISMEKNPTWFVPPKIQKEMEEKGLEVKKEVPPGPENPLGPRWIGFADNTYGFHGTLVPSSIKRYASHGCVRFLARDVIDLYDRVSVGMPVTVVYQPVTMAVDRHSVWVSVFPDYYDLGYDYRTAIKTLARQAGVAQRLHWPSVEKALRLKDGILVDVGQPLAPTRPTVLKSQPPHPVTASPLPTVSPLLTPMPSPTPWPSPTLNPALWPSTSPAPESPSPSASGVQNL